MIQKLPSSPSLSAELLLDEIRNTLQKRWVKPPVFSGRWNTPPDQVETLAKATLDAMLTRPWRISKLPPEEEYNQLLAKVRHWVAKGRAIRVRLGYAPMKNLNTVRVSRADWSEFFALGHLAAWQEKICSVYPPGVRIKIVFDDSTVAMANRHDSRHMDSYINSVRQLVRVLGYQSFIVGTMRQSSFAWLFNFGLYQWAGRRVRKWEQDPANQPVIEQMLQFARRNVLLPPGLTPEAQEQFFRDASHRYRVYWEALQMSGLSRFGKSLIGMYLDGNQHHVRQDAALHLATVGKEQVTQPWQGEGGLQDNGKGKLVPIVLTGGRREKLVIQEVTGLDLVPMPGFDAIQICWEAAKMPT